MTQTIHTEDRPEAAADQWLSPEDIARTMHVHSSTIRRLIARGELEATKIGEQWRIKQSAWEAHLAAHTRYNRSQAAEQE